ncbi:hypothetical protein INT48_007204 [Thamnidium elegans]|uniref:Uncharacterized protein n=1 Tax=Thamnidium elegans TaxID=101142 RepID=A0A8H7VTY1_9FUNG|nr:hypothetical protein INT48_007204 [Thamnidium elegans]
MKHQLEGSSANKAPTTNVIVDCDNVGSTVKTKAALLLHILTHSQHYSQASNGANLEIDTVAVTARLSGVRFMGTLNSGTWNPPRNTKSPLPVVPVVPKLYLTIHILSKFMLSIKCLTEVSREW